MVIILKKNLSIKHRNLYNIIGVTSICKIKKCFFNRYPHIVNIFMTYPQFLNKGFMLTKFCFTRV